MAGRHLRNGLGAADAPGNNLSTAQEYLAVQRLLMAFDPKRRDIEQYHQMFEGKTRAGMVVGA